MINEYNIFLTMTRTLFNNFFHKNLFECFYEHIYRNFSQHIIKDCEVSVRSVGGNIELINKTELWICALIRICLNDWWIYHREIFHSTVHQRLFSVTCGVDCNMELDKQNRSWIFSVIIICLNDMDGRVMSMGVLMVL